MRARIITSASFTGDRAPWGDPLLGHAGPCYEGRGSAEYVWSVKNVATVFVKVDQGLAEEIDGVQLMKPIPGLNKLSVLAEREGPVEIKTHSVIKLANQAGVDAAVDEAVQRLRSRILDAGMAPIIELQVDIT